MEKKFNVNDKVFAKVKGYPAWPAQVTAVNGKKYTVQFYGTGETGILKPEDIFYYLKHKHLFVKSLKRKHYTDAIEEIEAAIAEDGSDGNSESAAAAATPEPAAKKNVGKKRKLSTSSTGSGDSHRTGKKRRSETRRSDESTESADVTLNVSEMSEEGLKQELEKVRLEAAASTKEKKKSESPRKKDADKDVNGDMEVSGDDPVESEDSNAHRGLNGDATLNGDRTKNLSFNFSNKYKDIHLIHETYLNVLIAYGQKVREMGSKFKEKKPDSVSFDFDQDGQTKVLPVKLPDGKYVGIKFAPAQLKTFESEYDRALDDERLAKDMLQLKNELADGRTKPTDGADNIVQDLKCDESCLYQLECDPLMRYKKEKHKWLRRELDLYHRMISIQQSLGMKSADTKVAIKHLNVILEMDVDPITFKKHPNIMHTAKRLKRYIGNANSWHLSAEEMSTFMSDAKDIRSAADKLFKKFKALLPYGNEDSFFENFQKDCDKFKTECHKMTDEEIFALVAEPYSRQSLLSEICEDLNVGDPKANPNNED